MAEASGLGGLSLPRGCLQRIAFLEIHRFYDYFFSESTAFFAFIRPGRGRGMPVPPYPRLGNESHRRMGSGAPSKGPRRWCNGRWRRGNEGVRSGLEAGANVIVTACPFCLVNMEDAIKVAQMEGKMEAIDFSELIARHLDA